MRPPIRVPHQIEASTAAAETLSRLANLQRCENDFRPVDLINIATFAANEAHELLLTDAATAREFLINGASRLIRAAEQLEAQTLPRGNVTPIRSVS